MQIYFVMFPYCNKFENIFQMAQTRYIDGSVQVIQGIGGLHK